MPARKPILQLAFACALLTLSDTHAGEAYFTSFENFPTGDDTLINTDGWTGSHPNLKLHGVMSQADHAVVGIGNAAYIGGNSNVIANTNKLVFVRRPVNLDPVALNQEIVTFKVAFGIKDSTSSSGYRRDNFEFRVYNQANLQLGGIQFDNTTLDTTTLPATPKSYIYRLHWNGSTWIYTNTNYKFIPSTIETLEFRINFRTNKWTVSLGGVPLFQDTTFYTGQNARNLGYVAAMMNVTNTAPLTGHLLPGDNYMLFDDYQVRTDPLTTTLAITKPTSGNASLTWNQEAGYSYQVLHSTDLTNWQSNLPNASFTATQTATKSYTDPTTPAPLTRFYRIRVQSP